MTLTTTATCRGCGWTAPAGDWAAVDKHADKHADDTGHAVATATRTAEAEAAIIAYALANPGCPAERDVTYPGKAERGVLVCSLGGHDGPVHYDPDGVFWVAAVKGMTRDQAETLAWRIREGLTA